MGAAPTSPDQRSTPITVTRYDSTLSGWPMQTSGGPQGGGGVTARTTLLNVAQRRSEPAPRTKAIRPGDFVAVRMADTTDADRLALYASVPVDVVRMTGRATIRPPSDAHEPR